MANNSHLPPRVTGCNQAARRALMRLVSCGLNPRRATFGAATCQLVPAAARTIPIRMSGLSYDSTRGMPTIILWKSVRLTMNLQKILNELRRERDFIDEAIASLERLLAASSRPRRGRPPKWLQAHKGRARKRGKREGTPSAIAANAA